MDGVRDMYSTVAVSACYMGIVGYKVGTVCIWEGEGREGKGREGKGREGKGMDCEVVEVGGIITRWDGMGWDVGRWAVGGGRWSD